MSFNKERKKVVYVPQAAIQSGTVLLTNITTSSNVHCLIWVLHHKGFLAGQGLAALSALDVEQALYLKIWSEHKQ